MKAFLYCSEIHNPNKRVGKADLNDHSSSTWQADTASILQGTCAAGMVLPSSIHASKLVSYSGKICDVSDNMSSASSCPADFIRIKVVSPNEPERTERIEPPCSVGQALGKTGKFQDADGVILIDTKILAAGDYNLTVQASAEASSHMLHSSPSHCASVQKIGLCPIRPMMASQDQLIIPYFLDH